MRIQPASASLAVTRALEALILASGHTSAKGADADLVLVDRLHPCPVDAPVEHQVILADSILLKEQGLVVPFHPRQLIAFLKARGAPSLVTLGGGWNVDLTARLLTHAAAAPVTLTEKECSLLAALSAAKPQALGREKLLAQVWGITQEIDTHTLETHIYRLRSKLSGLDPASGDIVTVEGAYKLVFNS